MSDYQMPDWLKELDHEDYTFMKRFILASGSLKEVASEYSVSYPTVRLRLDRLIEKIQVNDKKEDEQYVALIKKLALQDKMDFETAKLLIQVYREQQKGE